MSRGVLPPLRRIQYVTLERVGPHVNATLTTAGRRVWDADNNGRKGAYTAACKKRRALINELMSYQRFLSESNIHARLGVKYRADFLSQSIARIHADRK